MNSRSRDFRGNKAALFDGIEEGGIRASASYSHEIDEHDNEMALEGLQDRVILLKRVITILPCRLFFFPFSFDHWICCGNVKYLRLGRFCSSLLLLQKLHSKTHVAILSFLILVIHLNLL
ncbi:hypothetical protein HS088_TW12G00107 [Tripterygium wilfordii]|uniref:Uncharacterized protein n=1 Tax=Tripterygium wilfordii TaxID=458696 RepID=A0A7J7CXT7_TRIWF|nr:hypothetical protein HS088_TW12G00107 [Tripterygium wilfordii]